MSEPSGTDGNPASTGTSDDAKQQRQPEIFGWPMGSFSEFLTALVTAAAVLAALSTLRKLERQTKATEQAAKAAEDSAATAETALHATQRAYVSGTFLVNTFAHPVTKQPVRWEIQVRWENNGMTLARPVKTHIGANWVKPDEFDSIPPPVPDKWPPSSSLWPLLPKGGTNIGDVPVTLDMVNGIQREEGMFVVVGYMEYEDVFYPATPIRHTQICSRVMVISDPSSTTTTPFRFRAYPKYNEAT